MYCKGKKLLIAVTFFLLFILPYGGLMALDPGQSIDQYVLDQWKNKEGLASNNIYSIAQTPDGYMWFATFKGLVRFDGVKFSTIQYGIKKNQKSKNKKARLLDVLFVDKAGILWIGGIGHLTNYRYQTGQFTTFTREDGLTGKRIYTINEDKRGNLWLGFMGCDLVRFVNGKFTKFKISPHQEGQWVTSIFEDRKWSLLVGTYKNKVFKFVDGNFHRYEIEGLKDAKFVDFAADGKYKKEVIYSLFEDRRGDIWLGAHSGNLLRYRNGKFIKSLKIPGISGSYINAIAEDYNGDLWLGTNRNGVFKKKGNTNTFINFTTRDGLADNYVISVSQDSKNNLWFSTGSGVSRYRNGVFKSLKKQDGLLGKKVVYTYEDKNQNIWILTSKGINVLKNGQFSRDNMITYSKDIGVVCIYEEDTSTNKGENVFWFGTYGYGLRRFKDGTFTSYTEKEGLNSNYIYQLFADDWGNFWMSSNKGTLRISKNQLDAFAQGQVDRIHCTAFDTSDGMSSVHFYNALSGSSAIKTRDGELLFVTKKGITMTHPGKLKINRIPPPVIIEDFFFKGSDHYSYNGLHSETIVFKGMNRIGFHFTSPTFLSSEKIKFKYKLEGHDKDWAFLAPGANRIASYEDLAPGTYVFKVTACSSDGIWNNSGDSLTFAITTCFQNSTSFKLLLLLGGLALVTAAVFLFKKYHPLARNGKAKYKNSHLNHAYVKECIRKLDYTMEIEKIYRDENISLQSLSKKVSITPHQLSRIINENLNKNFPDFINTHRVEEAKKILADPKQADRKILNIAFDVGFNTKVAFNTAFKKYTNMTPSQFRKKARKQ